MAEAEHKIRVEEIHKIFGPDPASVMGLVRSGTTKADLLERTGHVIGLRDVSLDIRPGETFVIMGLSGSGKSTLIRHFNRLIEPTAGKILVDGQDVMGLTPEELLEFRRRRISMVFQRFALLPHRTVLENVIYGLVIGEMPEREATERGMEQIELVGLQGFENHYPKQLSGGMQQRVGLARALATDSEVMLMDEAFSALDPLIRNDMQEQLKELQSKLRKTIVFITHDLDEALRIGDHIAILNDGELRQVGTGADVLLRPADDYVERFVRDVNRARVINIGSLAEPVSCVPASEVTAERCGALLERSAAVVVVDGDTPRCVVDRDTARREGADLASCVGDLPKPSCVGADASLEDSFKAVAESKGPVVVTGEDSQPVGVVSQQAVLSAMAKG